MYDSVRFVETLSGFARTLVSPYEVEDVLAGLTENATAVFGLVGCGVSLLQDGRLNFANGVHPAAVALEEAQHEYGRGPCLEATHTGEVVAITDLSEYAEQWPEYVAIATRHGVHSVAGIPLSLATETIGALNLYSAQPRDWSPDDLRAARALADMATAYLVNASKLAQQSQLNQQLQQALEKRLVIEQAKGITAQAHHASVEAAFGLIRRHARNHNISIQTVAEAIVNAGLRV